MWRFSFEATVTLSSIYSSVVVGLDVTVLPMSSFRSTRMTLNLDLWWGCPQKIVHLMPYFV